ncbi:AAA domain-containing protein, partial [Durusdinium trenchii]
MSDTVNKTQAVGVQVIGLVPNIAHTAYTVHVKSKGMIINTFNVECDLVARRLVLKDDGKPELYSVQSLSVNLPPTAQTSTSATTKAVWVRQLLHKDDNGGFELVGNAFQIDPAPSNI